LLELTKRYVETKVKVLEIDGIRSDLRDLGIYYWRLQAVNILLTAINSTGLSGAKPIPILGTPEYLDSSKQRGFQWSGILADGKKCHTNKVPCSVDLEKTFANFLDKAPDVIRYIKNERFGFSITYYEANRPRQYYPDFIIVSQDKNNQVIMWLAEPKGEIRPNTAIKAEAASLWCEKMSKTNYGQWRYQLVPQVKFESALRRGIKSLFDLQSYLDELS
jgi:hypothetical protein